MLRLFSAYLLLLAACFGGLVLGELSSNFSRCLDYFYNSTPPQGISGSDYQPICQRYKNVYRFATLYHRQRRVPLYSAYQLNLRKSSRPKAAWKYEPQLAFSKASPDMKVFPRKRLNQNVKESQAVPDDYRNSSFTRGHLNPSMHQGTTEDREATFTLTNIVPQKKASNAGPWNDLEKEVLRNFQDYCNGPMYVITGALLYASNNRRLNNRVSVPEYLWSAYCCPSFSDQLPAAMKPFFPAYAAVGRNDPNSTEEIVPADVTAEDMVKGYGVKKMSVSALEDILNQRLASNISLFSRQCK